jgi:hypothetical protein
MKVSLPFRDAEGKSDSGGTASLELLCETGGSWPCFLALRIDRRADNPYWAVLQVCS